MPFTPHTSAEIRTMLERIGVASLDELFAEIPRELLCSGLAQLPPAQSELEITQLMTARAQEDGRPLGFIGAGAYEHHIPAAVWQIATRGEFYSSYTPYQAEASQGTLQLLYEYQSMMTALMAMDVANASLYDGASSLAEAILMAIRCHRRSHSKSVLLPRSLHPAYRAVARAITRNQGVELIELPFDPRGGHLTPATLAAYEQKDIAALVIAQPNFFGVMEDVDLLTDWAHQHHALVIGVVNPLAMAVLSPPGDWGDAGVDICCGEGQPLGIPLSSGGPYFGFMCCREEHMRQLPGRIVGRTLDLDARPGFTLTLQAREQHIRRSKATSNICTNQGLMVTAATIHMALLGAEGLERVAALCHANTQDLVTRLTAIPGVTPLFERLVFHEQALRLPAPVKEVLRSLAAHNVLGGYDLGGDYPELDQGLLVCATEVRTARDIDNYAAKLARIIAARSEAKCPVQPKF